MSDSIPALIAEAEHAATYPDVKPIRADLVERLVNALRESLSAPSGDDREAQAAWERHLITTAPYRTDDWTEDRAARARGMAYRLGYFAGWRDARRSSRVVVAAPSDTDRDFKRIPAEIRAELIHMAEGRIKDVWTDAPEGVDAATLASNVVAAQEFVWMQLAAGVDLRTSQPVQVEVTEEAVTTLAKHMANVASDWNHNDCGDDDHPLGHSNWDAYTDDARRALAALGGGE